MRTELARIEVRTKRERLPSLLDHGIREFSIASRTKVQLLIQVLESENLLDKENMITRDDRKETDNTGAISCESGHEGECYLKVMEFLFNVYPKSESNITYGKYTRRFDPLTLD